MVSGRFRDSCSSGRLIPYFIVRLESQNVVWTELHAQLISIHSPIGLSGLIGLNGLISDIFLGGVLSGTTVNVVLIVLRLLCVWLSGRFLLCWLWVCDWGHFWSFKLMLDNLLLSELLTFRSSWLSIAVLFVPSALLGGRDSWASKSAYSISVYFSSVRQPFQQSLQSHTRNLKQNASIFIQGWKHIQRFR